MNGPVKVVVRVWNSALNNGEHYGHVSLETNECYVSLWPSDKSRGELAGIGCVIARARVNETHQDDVNAEGRPEDARFYLYLSSKKAHALCLEWRRLSQQDLTWFALGTNRSRETVVAMLAEEEEESVLRTRIVEHVRNGTLLFNCASIVDYLLKTGGLNLDDYLEIDSIHHPVVQGVALSVVSRNPNAVKLIAFLSEISYPDKVGHLAKRAMVVQVAHIVKCDLGNHSFVLSEQADVDKAYNFIMAHENSPGELFAHFQALKQRRESERCQIL